MVLKEPRVAFKQLNCTLNMKTSSERGHKDVENTVTSVQNFVTESRDAVCSRPFCCEICRIVTNELPRTIAVLLHLNALLRHCLLLEYPRDEIK